GLFFVEPAHLSGGAADPAAVLGTAGILLFAFAGVEGALIPSGEVRAPARTVPRAVFLALGAATLLYLAIQVVAQGVLGAALAISGTFERLAVLANVSVLLVYALCALAAWRLRRRDVRADGEPFRIAGGPLVPALALAAISWVLWATVTRRELVAVGIVLVA